jgi:phosphate:Na+ symporter
VYLKRAFLFLLFVIAGTFSWGQTAGLQPFNLLKPVSDKEHGFSGDRQHGQAGDPVSPLRAKVINERSEPVIGIPVIFEVVNYPSGGGDYVLENRLVTTDSSGIATANFRLGTAGGEYQIIARIRSAGDENIQFYTIFARDSDWLLFLVLGLVGGLALFLLGMEVMSRGLLRTAGDKMRTILGNITNNRFKALGLGAFVTMVIQSSSATNVMLVSFVNAELMRFRQTLGVVLGAAIGTTITAQLIAFRLTDFSLLFIAVGFVLHSFSGRESYRNTGDALMGFGILFFGMYVMSDSMYPLRSFEPFIRLLLKMENPLVGILIGTVFTALIQSSSAFIGIMIVLGTQGLISLEASIPLLFGANIGTAVTALLASIKAGNEARKVAVAITVFKIFGVLLFVLWINPFASAIEYISPAAGGQNTEIAGMAEVIPRQIANAHTVYNVFVSLLVLPFIGFLARIVEWIMPVSEPVIDNEFKAKYLDDNMLKTPVMGLNLAKKETIRMAEVVYEMVSLAKPLFINKDSSVLKNIAMQERKVDFLRDQISSYLLKISRNGVREERVDESFQILYTVKEFELIADVVSDSLVRKADQWINTKNDFSKEGRKELEYYHEKTCKLLKKAIEVFSEINIEKALEMKLKYKEYRTASFEFEKQHYRRLEEEVPESVLSSETHLELMAMLRTISSHATNIARIILQWNEAPSNK